MTWTWELPAWPDFTCDAEAIREAEAGFLQEAGHFVGVISHLAGTILDAQKRALRVVAFVVEKGKFLDRLRGRLNARQEKVLLRMFEAGPDGFIGGLSAGNYRSIGKISVATTTRDLNGLVELGALTKTGDKRHARYWLTVPESL